MKLLNFNISIKINNNKEISRFIKDTNADFVALQEVVKHFESSVHEQYKSKESIETFCKDIYPYNFFGPLWKTNIIIMNKEIYKDFGGLIEQGNEILSKYPIINSSNEHFYKSYYFADDWTDWYDTDHGRALLITELEVDGKPLQILNIHGIWTKDKLGDERTIKECEYVVNAAKRKDIATIITGDFNLLPQTKSIKIISNEFRNLVTEFDIKSTRPDFNDGKDAGLNVVDYVFVNDKVKVNNLEVINTNISDHLPLILDFDL